MNRFAIGKLGALFRRFAPAVIAAYLLYWGIWDLLFVADQLVMSAVTKTVNWVALEIFHNFSFIEEEGVLVRYLLQQIGFGVVPLILGLLVGWWVWRKRRKTPQHPLQASQSN